MLLVVLLRIHYSTALCYSVNLYIKLYYEIFLQYYKKSNRMELFINNYMLQIKSYNIVVLNHSTQHILSNNP